MGTMRGSTRAWETGKAMIYNQSNDFRLDICSVFAYLHLILMQ